MNFVEIKTDTHRKELLANDCIFCSAIKPGGVTPKFQELFPELSCQQQVLLENKAFLLIPDDSPIIQDHLLLISKQHVLSCASLAPEDYLEFLDLKKRACDFLRWASPSSSVLFFEHGSGRIKDNVVRCGTSLGIDHAHTHALPIPPEIAEDTACLQSLIDQAQNILQIPSSKVSPDDLLRYKDQPYILLEANGEINLFTPQAENARYIPSQFVRRLLGSYLGLPDSDWDLRHLHSVHRDLEKSRITQTIQRFKNYEQRGQA